MSCELTTTSGRAAMTGRIVAAACLALTLGGCYSAKHDVTASIPDDYRQRHPITIQEGRRTMDVFIGTRRGGLTPTQRAEVLAFAQTWRSEATGGVIIDLPTRTTNAEPSRAASTEIKSIFAATGMPPQSVEVRGYQPPDPTMLAPIRLIYPRVTAQAGPCGTWPDDLGPSINSDYYENREYYNLGCASQRNLAAMVDEPADLVQPRGSTPPYAARRSFAINKYRQGQSPATETSAQDQKAQISDVGKQ